MSQVNEHLYSIDRFNMKKAVILLSGGLDSATVLAIARDQGYECYALSLAYGQRHSVELEAADRVAKGLGVVAHKVIQLSLDAFGGSALTDNAIAVPEEQGEGIPVTYVPARNTIFLSLALGWAEVLGARDLFLGVNAVDYSGYPDCRPEFIEAFEALANLATKAGVEGERFTIHAPLINLTKAEIIQQGQRLGVDYGLTISCYQATVDGIACGVCDSCRLRAEGFRVAGVTDPTHYLKRK
ncbi:MAG: 7-cyano-7-deazaguanine synthase QueC [Sedimenticola sp.]|nr:7-cyano-7-deazaguanine synthase QueC [Sedimenticola sp.]